MEAKLKELDSRQENEVYEEVKRKCQKLISTRHTVTEKSKEWRENLQG